MKNLKLLPIILFLIFAASCEQEDTTINGEFQFIEEYKAMVTVGGFVGVMERTFEVGEIYVGTDEGGEMITIRIEEHTDRNEGCPDSWCYQEFLEVPRGMLKIEE